MTWSFHSYNIHNAIKKLMKQVFVWAVNQYAVLLKQ